MRTSRIHILCRNYKSYTISGQALKSRHRLSRYGAVCHVSPCCCANCCHWQRDATCKPAQHYRHYFVCVCVLFLYFSVLSSPLSLSAKFVSSITEVMREWQAQPNVRQIKPTQRAFGTHCNIVILTYLMFSGSVLTSESSVVKQLVGRLPVVRAVSCGGLLVMAELSARHDDEYVVMATQSYT